MARRRTINSPGVDIGETDISVRNESVGTSVLLIGFAAKGPIYEPLIVTSISEFEEIFVRESGSERYLIFKNGTEEDIWKIVDQDTLMKGSDLMSLKLVRIK